MSLYVYLFECVYIYLYVQSAKMAEQAQRDDSAVKVDAGGKAKTLTLAEYIAKNCGKTSYCKTLEKLCETEKIAPGQGSLTTAQETALNTFAFDYTAENPKEFIATMIAPP